MLYYNLNFLYKHYVLYYYKKNKIVIKTINIT